MQHVAQSFSRRQMLKGAACGFGSLAVAGMQGAQALTGNPLAAKASLIPQRAKRVIFIFMVGGPSHVDTFDYKPELARHHGKTIDIEMRRRSIRKEKILGPVREFKRRGQSGL